MPNQSYKGTITQTYQETYSYGETTPDIQTKTATIEYGQVESVAQIEGGSISIQEEQVNQINQDSSSKYTFEVMKKAINEAKAKQREKEIDELLALSNQKEPLPQIEIK